MTIEINDRGEARKVLLDYELTERAIDNAFHPIASSLMVDGRKGVEKLQGERKDALKGWIESDGHEDVIDGEMEVRAYTKPRKTPAVYDIETVLQLPGGKEAILEAAAHGMVRIDDKMLLDYRKRSQGASWADLLYHWRKQLGETTALYIERGQS